MARSSLPREAVPLLGTVVAAAFTNTTYTIDMGPGFWRIALFINANGVSAGNMVATIVLPDGTASETDSPEQIYFMNGSSLATSLALTDFIGVTHLNSGYSGGTTIPVGAESAAVAVHGFLRLTISSIAGAGATNRIDYMVQRIQ